MQSNQVEQSAVINRTVLHKAAYWLPHYVERAVRAKVSDDLARAYGLADTRMRGLALRPVQQINRVVDFLATAGSASATIMYGSEAASGLPLKVGLLGIWETGQRNTLPHIEHLFFDDGPVTREPAGNFSLWQLRERAEALASQVDLLVVLASSLVTPRPDRGSWASGPAELRMVFDYHPGEHWEQVEQRLKGQKGNLKRLRRQGYTSRASRSDADFELFYHHFYVPMVKTRYKEYGDINSEAGLRRQLNQNGELLFIEDAQGSPVCAELNIRHHGVMYALLAGVRGGDRALVHDGAMAALYYHSLRRGFDLGCRRHDAGVCLPFASSGVLQHKRMWGYKPLPNPWRPWSLLLWAPRSAPAALHWMQANPFLPPFGTLR